MQRKGDRNSHIHDDAGQKISAGIIHEGHVPHSDPWNVEVIAVFRRQSGNIVMEAATVPPKPCHTLRTRTKEGVGYGGFKMNQSNRVARVLASVDESRECISIGVARRICELLQLWEKVVGGFSII